MRRYYFTAIVHIDADSEAQAMSLLWDALTDAVFVEELAPAETNDG